MKIILSFSKTDKFKEKFSNRVTIFDTLKCITID